jgi:hypothetical protein
MKDFRVLRHLVWVMTINFWGLCPQTPEVYRLDTNPEEVKRGQQVVSLFGFGPCLGARVAPQQSPNYLWLKDF